MLKTRLLTPQWEMEREKLHIQSTKKRRKESRRKKQEARQKNEKEMKTTLPAVDLLKEPQLLGLLRPLTSGILKIPCWTRTALEEKKGVPVQWCCHKQQDYERRRGHQRN
ncbi:putative mucin-associated surface protein (MASP) [Trypanosoma cruzi]|nr:putative mucin-associated surface protein (MASP) [Trypanosoma cruzi]